MIMSSSNFNFICMIIVTLSLNYTFFCNLHDERREAIKIKITNIILCVFMIGVLVFNMYEPELSVKKLTTLLLISFGIIMFVQIIDLLQVHRIKQIKKINHNNHSDADRILELLRENYRSNHNK